MHLSLSICDFGMAFHRKRRQASVLTTISIISGMLIACDNPPKYGYIEGETMGTSYHIRYRYPEASEGVDKSAIQQAIDTRLADINNSMSTYQDDSTISTFNRLPANTPLTVDRDFINVLTDARQVYDLSGGAFDPTVMPLIELWGFGSKMTVDRLQNPPSAAQIAKAKSLIGFGSIQLQPNMTDNGDLSKLKSGVALDFSAIAKGYAVDAIADTLQDSYQITNYMVEIGGEVATSGLSDRGQPWQIAIDAPIINSSVTERETIAIIRQPQPPAQLHIATSGNYRNSVVFDGVRYSHTIDPTTGSPIVDGAASVTVAADSVSLADAWATALTAMPYPKALTTAEEQHLAVMFVVPSTFETAIDTTTAINTDINISNDTSSNDSDTLPEAITPPATTENALKDWQVVETTQMRALRASNSN